MTEVEMEHILEKASNNYKSGGLFKSEARGGLTPEDSFKPSDGRLFRQNLCGVQITINVKH